MKKVLVFCSVLVFCFSLHAESEKELIKKLPQPHRVWLSEEVVYIITSVEKEVFLQLESDRERNTFISAFWKQRNPNPNLPENEFKKEHYQRLAYVNNWFGRDAPAPGWRTDQGRIYITLGEPHSIERFESESDLVPTVVWFYQGMAAKGLPESFSVVFFKKDSIGAFELYSPVKYGPQALMRNFEGDATSYEAAYYALMDIQPQLAAVSLSLITGEPVGVNPSLASEFLIREKIPETPQRTIKSIYARNFLKFKGQIEIDYADNFMESSSQLNVVRHPSGHYFIHYLIEPKRLSLEQYKEKYYTTLEISGNISDHSGKMLTQISRRIPLELSENQMRMVKDKLFSFQDMIPVIPGSYRLTIFLKNLITKEFTSMEKDFVIPAGEKLAISTLLLANRKAAAAGSVAIKPFLFAGSHLLPSPRNDFLAADNLELFFQLHGLSKELIQVGSLEISLFRRGEKVFTKERLLRDLGSLPDVLETLPLKGQSPAYYNLKVSLFDQKKSEIATENADFYITPKPSLPRPWVVSVPTAGGDFSVFLNELGRQYVQSGDLDKARPLLESSFRQNPNNVRFGSDYCQLLLQKKEFAKVKALALPQVKEKSRFEFALPLGQACQGLNEFDDAITFYADFITHFGANINVFNQIGECYFQLGNTAEALKAWEKSLELNTKQPRIREKVAGLQKTAK